MSLLPIITAPDPRLKAKSRPIPAVDDRVRRLMDDMLETMYAAPGVGLSAIQVGVAKRIIVIDVAREDEKPQPIFLANPELLWLSEEMSALDEGCLSLPDQFEPLERPARCRVRFLDRQNEIRELEADGLLSRCIQHEMDHLDGTLFVDHLSLVKRNMILRRLGKSKRQKAFA
jgi:peptide deformylase